MPLIVTNHGNLISKSKEKPMNPNIMLGSYTEPIYDQYTLYVITVATFRSYYYSQFNVISKALNIHHSQSEDMFDWIITEAISKVLRLGNGSGVVNHHKHDLYKCAYDHIGHYAEMSLTKHISLNRLTFIPNEKVKVLVTGDNLIIAKGIIHA